MDIIYTIFTKLFFVQVNFNPSTIDNEKELKRTFSMLDKNSLYSEHLDKHIDYSSVPQKIVLELSLNDTDIENILYIREHKQHYKELLEKYSNINLNESLNNLFEGAISENVVSIVITFEDHPTNDNQKMMKLENTNALVDYLRYFELFLALDSWNSMLIQRRVKQEDEKLNIPYKSTCILEGPYRQYDGEISVVSLDANDHQEVKNKYDRSQANKGASTRQPNNTNFTNSIDSFMRQFSIIHFDKLERGEVLNVEQMNELIKKDFRYKLIKQYLDLEIRYVNKVGRLSYVFDLFNGERPKKVASLSTGERAILGLIMLAYSEVSSRGSLVMVDEPELHLHTQLQSKYREILLRINEDTNTQIIINTHSPVFIDTNTFDSVKRVVMKNRETNIIDCGEQFNNKEKKEFLKPLELTNSSIVFFADRVLLVEGEADEMFFRAYLKKFYPNQNIEVVKLGGKDNSDKFITFLERIGVQSTTLRDLDAIRKEFHEEDYRNHEKTLKILKNKYGEWDKVSTLEMIESLDSYYKTNSDAKKVLKTIAPMWKKIIIKSGGVTKARLKTEVYNDVLKEITIEENNGRYYLKEGAIEDYCAFIEKERDSSKVGRMIKFLSSDDWFERINFQDELNEKFNKILGITLQNDIT